jgi:hypothetical protein
LQLRGRILDGHDSLGEREQDRSEPTLRDLATHYLERYAVPHKRPTNLRNDRQMIAGTILPKLDGSRL